MEQGKSIRSLSPQKILQSERNYSAIEREALAIVQGVKHFRTYLQESKFTIETDHNPLTQLGNLKDSHGRLSGPYHYSNMILQLYTEMEARTPMLMGCQEISGL